MLGVVLEGLTFLRAVDAAETYAFSMVAIQHFDGVAVEDGNDRAGELSRVYVLRGYHEEQRDKQAGETQEANATALLRVVAYDQHRVVPTVCLYPQSTFHA